MGRIWSRIVNRPSTNIPKGGFADPPKYIFLTHDGSVYEDIRDMADKYPNSIVKCYVLQGTHKTYKDCGLDGWDGV